MQLQRRHGRREVGARYYLFADGEGYGVLGDLWGGVDPGASVMGSKKIDATLWSTWPIWTARAVELSRSDETTVTDVALVVDVPGFGKEEIVEMCVKE